MAVYNIKNPYASVSLTEGASSPSDDHYLEHNMNPNFDMDSMWKHTQYHLIPGHEEHGLQPFLRFKGRNMRVRAEMIVFNERGQVLVKTNTSYKRGDNTVEFPGGAVDRGETPLQAAIRETQEEALVNVRDAYYTNIYYWYEVPESETKEWKCDGHISYICCAIENGRYTGHIADIDKDSFAKKASWCDLNELNLPNAHEAAISQYKQYLRAHGISGRDTITESAVLDESGDYDENLYQVSKCKSPEDLNKFLNTFKYGIILQSKGITITNDVDSHMDEYLTADCHTFLKYKVGTCWDFTNFEYWFFKNKLNYKFTTDALKEGSFSAYFMMHKDPDGDMPSHTWIAYMKNGKAHLFESSWKNHAGIRTFSTEKDMINYYDKEQRAQYGNKLSDCLFLKYVPIDHNEVKPESFMKHAIHSNTSRIIHNTFDKYSGSGYKYMTESAVLDESLGKSNNILFSEDDIYCNMEKWDNGESHILFVLGLSGSGKSTLADKLAEKNKCKVTYIDSLAFSIVGVNKAKNQRWEYIKEKDIMLYKFMKHKKLEPDFMAYIGSVTKDNPVLSAKDEGEKQKWVDKYIHWLCFEQKERCIVEGGHACVTISEHKEYQSFPIVFKGTSLINSIVRRSIRAHNKGKFDLSSFLNLYYTQYSKMFPEVNAARKAVIGNDNYQMVKESTAVVAEFKEPKTINSGGDIPLSVQDKNKYMGMFEADEVEWRKKIEFLSDPRVRNGKPQPVFKLQDGYYRARAEVLVLDMDTGKVLIDPGRHRCDKMHYTLPGGGIDDPKVEIADSAKRECEEEARIIPKRITYTGIAYVTKFKVSINNAGSITFVCIAERGKDYKSYVKKEDRDPFVDRAKWVDPKMLAEPHKRALEDYKKTLLKEDWIPDINYSFLNREIPECMESALEVIR